MAAHRSGIGTWLTVGLVTRGRCWLPRRQRACPSAALDERVSTEYRRTWLPPGASAGSRARPSLSMVAAQSPSVVRCACRRANEAADHRADRRARPCASTSSTRSSCIDDGSTDDTAAIAAAAGARVVARGDGAARGRAGLGQGQRDVEVAVRLHAATSSAGSTPTCATSAASSSNGCCAPLLDRPDDDVREGATTRARSKARRPAAAASPSSSPARCCRCCSRSSPTSCNRSAASTRRGASALEVVPFVEGWGVELGLLVDVVERFGRDAVAQVDLGVREHRNRPLDELGPQALAVMATALRRAGLCPRRSRRSSSCCAPRPTARSRRSRSRCASARRSSRCRRTERVSRPPR